MGARNRGVNNGGSIEDRKSSPQWEDNAASGIESSWFFIFHPGGVGKWRNYVKRWPDDDKTAAEGGGGRVEIRRTKGTIIGKSRNFPFGLLFGIDPLVYWSKLFASMRKFCFVVSLLVKFSLV